MNKRVALVNDALWKEIEPLLPAAEPRQAKHPGRQPLEARRALEGILFVLRIGIGWNSLPRELGFGCGSACHKRLSAWAAAGEWEALHRALVARLNEAGQIDWRRAVVDPSAVSAANLHDVNPVLSLVEARPTKAPPKRGGRARRLLADAAYDSQAHRATLCARGLLPVIRRRWTPHGSGLDKERCVVEHTIGRLRQFRRLRLRYERKGTLPQALLTLACSAICAHRLVTG